MCEHTILPEHDVIISNGKIAAIRPTMGIESSRDEAAQLLIESAQSIIDGATGKLGDLGNDRIDPLIIDARGAYVTPGIIDIHSDYIETVASPRPTSVMDLGTSLYRAERELVGHGVTTIYHSLSIYQNKIFDHKPIRNFSNVSKLIEEISDMRSYEEVGHLIRHRLHMRIELDSVEKYEDIKDYVSEGFVDLLSFMDHTPGQGQYADLKIFSDTLKGYRDLNDKEIDDIIALQQSSDKITLPQMIELAEIARSQGVAVASHDDDTIEKLDIIENFQPSISEFPITMEVAREARKRGLHTLAGAPNVMMGRSHSGNLSAREAIKAGAIDVLCSDYYPAALLGAVFALNKYCGVELEDSFALVTINPAKATGIDSYAGSIEAGKQADILIVREVGEEVPVVSQAFVGGNCVYQSHYPTFENDYRHASGNTYDHELVVETNNRHSS